MTLVRPHAYEFGPFRLDPHERVLLREGRPVSLTPKAFDLLLLLVEHPGRLLEKQALMQAVWPDTFVEETNLAYNVSALRKALGDGREEPQYIETVPTRGYRFVAPVNRVDGTPAVEAGLPSRQGGLRQRLLIVALALALLVTLPLALLYVREERPAPRPARLTLQVSPVNFWTPFMQISPDGRQVAVGRLTPEGWRVSLHSIESNASVPISVTGSGRFSWSPDSRNLVFFAGGMLKRVALSGEAPRTLCAAAFGLKSSWSRSGFILFDGNNRRGEPLRGVPASGGECLTVTHLDRSQGELTHLWPHFLPDGRRFLYTIRMVERGHSGVYVGSLDSDERTRILDADAPAIYAAGHLLYPTADGLVARPFDVKRLKLHGEPVVVATGGTWKSVHSVPLFSVSDTAVLAYPQIEFPRFQFAWFDRTGKFLGTVGEPGPYTSFDLSPDGTRLAFNRHESNRSNIWVLDIPRGGASRVTFGAGQHFDPRWAPDGERLAFWDWGWLASIAQVGMDGKIAFLTEQNGFLDDWSPDGRFLLIRRLPQLLAVPLDSEKDPVLVREAPAGIIDQSRFSPGARFIAYNSNESGRFEVYVTPFPPTEQRWQISTEGGVQPLWRQDGREVYYLGPTGTLFAVDFDATEKTAPGVPRALFATSLTFPSSQIEDYAVVADGRRFLIRQRVEPSRTSIGLILDWPALVRPDRRR